MIRKMALVLLLLPSLLLAEGEKVAAHDSLWFQGHAYRQWMYDQNSIGDRSSNLDVKIEFIADGKIRIHQERVYFYTNIDLAIQIARDTNMPLAIYVFDHTCSNCLNHLPELYERPDVIEKSRHFVNVYIEIPRDNPLLLPLGIMSESLSVQFFTPGMRRIRALSGVRLDNLLLTYDLIIKHVETLSEENMQELFERKAPQMRQAKYR